MSIADARAGCSQLLRRLKYELRTRCQSEAAAHVEVSKQRVIHMAMHNIPALRRVVRSTHVSCSPLVAIQRDGHLLTESSMIQDALFDFWVKRVFQQHDASDSFPPPPSAYDEFVSGSHPYAKEIGQRLEAPLTIDELKAAAQAMNPKAVTIDAPTSLLRKLGPEMLEAFRIVFNAFYLHQTNVAFALHLLLCMLPKTDDLTDVQRRRPIGVASVVRKWLFLTINRRLFSVAMQFKLIHPAAFGFMEEVDVFDVIYPLYALRDWAHIMGIPLFVLWIDSFKAYDSVSWAGLFAYMCFCGMHLLAKTMWTAFKETSWAFLA
eukprot:gene2393-2411_t